MLNKMMSNADKILIGIIAISAVYIVVNIFRAGVFYAMN